MRLYSVANTSGAKCADGTSFVGTAVRPCEVFVLRVDFVARRIVDVEFKVIIALTNMQKLESALSAWYF